MKRSSILPYVNEMSQNALIIGVVIILFGVCFLILASLIYKKFRGVRYTTYSSLGQKFSQYVYKNRICLESYNIVLVVGDPALKRQFADNFIVTDLQYSKDIVDEESAELCRITFIYIKDLCIIIPEELDIESMSKNVESVISVLNRYSQNSVVINSILLLTDIDENPTQYQKAIIAACEATQVSIPLYVVINTVYDSAHIQSFIKAASGHYLLQTCGYSVEEYTKDVNTHILHNRFAKMALDIESLCLALNMNTTYQDSKNIIHICHKIKSSTYDLSQISTKIANMFNNVHRPSIRGFYLTFCAIYFNVNRFIFLSDLLALKIYEERNLVFYDKTLLSKKRSKLLEILLSLLALIIGIKVGIDSYHYIGDYYYLKSEINNVASKVENYNVQNNNSAYLQDLVSSFTDYKKRSNYRYNIYPYLLRMFGIRSKLDNLIDRIADQTIFLITGMVNTRIDNTMNSISRASEKLNSYSELQEMLDSNESTFDKNIHIIRNLRTSLSRDDRLALMSKIKKEYNLDNRFYEFIQDNIDVIGDMLNTTRTTLTDKKTEDFCLSLVNRAITLCQKSNEHQGVLKIYDLCNDFFNEKDITKRIEIAGAIHGYATIYDPKKAHQLVSLSVVDDMINKLTKIFFLNQSTITKLKNVCRHSARPTEDVVNDRMQIILGHLFERRDNEIVFSASFESLCNIIRSVFASDLYKFYINYVRDQQRRNVPENCYLSFRNLSSLPLLTKDTISLIEKNRTVGSSSFTTGYIIDSIQDLYNHCIEHIFSNEAELLDIKTDNNVIERTLITSFNNNIAYLKDYKPIEGKRSSYVDTIIRRFFLQIIHICTESLSNLSFFADPTGRILLDVPLIHQTTSTKTDLEATQVIIGRIKKVMEVVTPYAPILEYINSQIYRQLETREKNRLDLILETIKVYRDFLANGRDAEMHKLIESIVPLSVNDALHMNTMSTVYAENAIYKEYLRSISRLRSIISESARNEIQESIRLLYRFNDIVNTEFPFVDECSSVTTVKNISNIIKACTTIIDRVVRFNEMNRMITQYKDLVDIIGGIRTSLIAFMERTNIDISIEMDKVFATTKSRTLSFIDTNTSSTTSTDIAQLNYQINNVQIAHDTGINIKTGPLTDNNLYYEEFRDSVIDCSASNCLISIPSPALLHILMENREKISIRRNKYSVYYRIPIIIKNLLKGPDNLSKTSGRIRVTVTCSNNLLNDLYNIKNIPGLFKKLEKYL